MPPGRSRSCSSRCKQVYDSQHPHFVLYARSQVEQLVGPELASKGGLQIYTTLDPDLQTAAEESVTKQVAQLGNRARTTARWWRSGPRRARLWRWSAARTSTASEISGQINMAVQPRQPGSALKPFIYLTSFEMPAEVSMNADDAQKALQTREAALSATPVSGQDSNAAEPPGAIEPPGYWTPGTTIMDILTEFPDPNGPYKPTNYDNKEHGLVTVRTALANSLNIPAVKALQHIGLDRFKDTMQKAGVTTLTRPDYGLSLALGGGEVTLLELTGAYATLANGGTRVPVSPDRVRSRRRWPLDLAGHGRARGGRLPRRIGRRCDGCGDHAATERAGIRPATCLPDYLDPVRCRRPAACCSAAPRTS